MECWSDFKKRLAGLLHPDWCWTELYTYYHTAVALNVGSQFLWRTKWKTQQPLCLNCDDEDCQWVVCNHSITEIDTLPAVYLLEGCVITLHSSCIGPDKEENRLQPLLNHTFGTLSFVLFFPDTIDAVQYMCEEYTAGSCAVMLISVWLKPTLQKN